MKVFIVLEHDYDGDYIRGVYSNEIITSNEDAAKEHEARDVNNWISEEEVLNAFVQPPEQEAPWRCKARSITLSERPGIQCRLMHGHDGPHECLP